MFKRTTIETLRTQGVNDQTTDQDLKKAFFKTNGSPIKSENVPKLRAAIAGDESLILSVEAASKAKTPKEPKAPKAAKEPKAPAEPKVAETAEAALARLKTDEKTAQRWARVVAVTEMGKRGPTRVRILCDDKGENGEDLFREIAVQDLFQVRYSAGYAKKNARKNRSASKARQAAEQVPAATA